MRLVSLKSFISKDDELIVLASKTLGHLVQNPSTTTFELAEEEFKYALNTIKADTSKDGFLRFAACCEIKEIAQRVPILYAVYLSDFLTRMWNVVRDQKDYIREVGVDTFALGLFQMQSREDLCERVYKDCIAGLSPDQGAAYIHGSVLTLNKMLQGVIIKLKPHFEEICMAVLRLKDHKNLLVRQAVLDIIPSICNFSISMNINDFPSLPAFIDYLFRIINSKEKELKLETLAILGKVAIQLGSQSHLFVQRSIDYINAEIRKKPVLPTLYEMLRGMCKTLGPKTIDYFEINLLITNIFTSADLNVYLLDCLNELINALLKSTDHRSRPYIYTICDKLLGLILNILNRRMERSVKLPRNDISLFKSITSDFSFEESFVELHDELFANQHKMNVKSSCLECEDHESKVNTVLALFALSHFEFRNTFILGSLVHSCVMPYLEDSCSIIRQHAVITSCTLTSIPNRSKMGIVLRNELMNILEKLLNVALTDPCAAVRYCLFKHIKPGFFPFLALESNLFKLMSAVNDKDINVRRVCIKLLAKLVGHNSSYIMPCLTQLLSQYMSELQMSTGLKQQQDSAVLLRALIKHTKQLMGPNLNSIIEIFIQLLKNNVHATLTFKILRGISACAEACKEQLCQYFGQLFPILIENLKDSSMLRRKGGLMAIIDIVTYTGQAITPYLKYESLLDTLLDVIKHEENIEIRKLAERTLGKLGALDQVKYKEIAKKQHSFKKSNKSTTVERNLSELHQKTLELTPSHDIYYPLVALKALMNIMCSPGNIHHDLMEQVLNAVFNIFHCYNRQLVPLLGHIIPLLVHVFKSVESPSREKFINTFQNISSVMGVDISDYVPEIVQIIDLNVNTPGLQLEMIRLLRELASHPCYSNLKDFPVLLHNAIRILETAEEFHLLEQVLNFIECLKGKIDQYLYIVIPALLKIIQDHSDLKLRKMAIRVIGIISDKNLHPHIVDFIARIVDTFLGIIKADSSDLVPELMDTLAFLVESLGNFFAAFIPLVQKVMLSKKISHRRYEQAVQDLIAGSEVVESPLSRNRMSVVTNEVSGSVILSESRHMTQVQSPYRHEMNVSQLLIVCDTTDRHTKEEWKDWMRRFSNELLKQAPAPALRECQVIEEYRNSLELFNASFVSCWSDLYDEDKNQMIKYLENAFDSHSIPTEVLQVLLNLAEFMEHDDHKLFDSKTLGKLAYKCKAYAKALHYKEVEFYTSAPNSEIIESLISLNNLLHQHEAAYGIRAFAKKKGWGDLSQSYQEFHRWQDAEELHEAINEQLITDPTVANRVDLTLIRMKCLNALSDWGKLMSLAEIKWSSMDNNESYRREIAYYAATAAWNLGKWEELDKYSSEMDSNIFEHPFYKAIMSIHENNTSASKKYLSKAWDIVDAKLPGLLRESYSRAYPVVLETQQLCDLEEVIIFKREDEAAHRRNELLKLCNKRLKGCQKSIEIWEKVLSYRPLLVCPEEDLDTWLQFAELCMRNWQMRLAGDVLETLLYRAKHTTPTQTSSRIFSDISNSPELRPALVCFTYLKYRYLSGFKSSVVGQLKKFVDEQESQNADGGSLCKYYLQLAKWQKVELKDGFNNEILSEVLKNIKKATEHDGSSFKAWHKWGIMNFEAISHFEKCMQSSKDSLSSLESQIDQHTDSALKGFIQSIYLEFSQANTLRQQNLLRLITLWFKYGGKEHVNSQLKESFTLLPVDVWLQVIPQIIARASTRDGKLRELINELLKKLSKHHPHALVYPLVMAARTSSPERKAVAEAVLQVMMENWPEIVKDTMLVAEELIRASVLWREAWHEGINEASQYYFGTKDVKGMLEVLKPLHETLNQGPKTMNDVGFYQAYGADLTEAESWVKRYEKTGKEINLQQAWNIYYSVYMRLKSVPKELDLDNVSPLLANARNLQAAIPGIYRSDKPVVRVARVDKLLRVFPTKQHPRRMSIIGDNGKEYQFLLKGREDSRQDERAMQLFGLINDLLAADPNTNSKDLSITRYAVVPLSPTCGLIGWVHGSDTLNQLIQEYRQRKRIETYVERELIKQVYSKYDQLPLINKVEIFEYAMSQTKGEDLQKILWSKSPTSEIWLERRTNYTRSLATMSMAGYILGLGDRHPSNLMLDRYTGKIIHIDFGDCFEVAMKREKCPEKVPFRLTRMLVNAMEISGIEGNFRNTCEQVMSVLRQNKDSLMAMLEVFLYEPLVSWRILAAENAAPSHSEEGEEFVRDRIHAKGPEAEMTEQLNKKAVDVLERVVQKLTGNDFADASELSVPEQVDRLIKEARSVKNLAQSYIGWCPFW